MERKKNKRLNLPNPRFFLASITALNILKKYNFPEPPITIEILERIIRDFGWSLQYAKLNGPDAYTCKFVFKDSNEEVRTHFAIRVATDTPINNWSVKENAKKWTVAHEIGHVLLHGHLPVSLDNNILIPSMIGKCATGRKHQCLEGTYRCPEKNYCEINIYKNFELEAHAFAAQLLMPDYAIVDKVDLNPNNLAKKCQVNFTPAVKRIKKLEKTIKNTILSDDEELNWSI